MTSAAVVFTAVLLSGLIAAQWPVYPVAQAPPALRPAIQRGNLVIVSLQSAVLRELTTAMAEGGPEHALQACHLEAAAVALKVSRNEGVEAGRTSVRLRNPRNAPPAWAAPIIAQHDRKTAGSAEVFVADLGDRVGLLRPIVAQAICASCHGPIEQMAPGVRAAIASRYPADRATGFHEGDLRGWFWVEVPKHPRAR